METERFKRMFGENPEDPRYGFKVGDMVKIPVFEKWKVPFAEFNLRDLDNEREDYMIVDLVVDEEDKEPYAILKRTFNESMTEEGPASLESGNVGKMETRKMKLKYLAGLMGIEK